MLRSALLVLKSHGAASCAHFFKQALQYCTNLLRAENFLTKFCFDNLIVIPPYFQPATKILHTIQQHKRSYSHNLPLTSRHRRIKTEEGDL